MSDPYRHVPPNPNAGPPRGDGSPRDAAYNPSFAPGRGFTPPIMGNPPPPPPPKNVFERIARAVGRYFGLQKRARASASQWWLLKILQGVLMSVPFFLGGIVLVLFSRIGNGSQCLNTGGLVLIIAGTLVFLWQAVAPLTQRWRVTIPEGEYWALEDGNRYTLAFLAGGPQAIDWHLNARVVRYVDFMRISKNLKIEGVFNTQNHRMDLEAQIVMMFDPTGAARENFPELRKMTRPEIFEHMIERLVRGVVLDTLQRRPYTDRLRLLENPIVLEDIILRALAPLAAWGLTPFSGRPVSVFVDGFQWQDMGGAPVPPPPQGTGMRQPNPSRQTGSYDYQGVGYSPPDQPQPPPQQQPPPRGSQDRQRNARRRDDHRRRTSESKRASGGRPDQPPGNNAGPTRHHAAPDTVMHQNDDDTPVHGVNGGGGGSAPPDAGDANRRKSGGRPDPDKTRRARNDTPPLEDPLERRKRKRNQRDDDNDNGG